MVYQAFVDYLKSVPIFRGFSKDNRAYIFISLPFVLTVATPGPFVLQYIFRDSWLKGHFNYYDWVIYWCATSIIH